MKLRTFAGGVHPFDGKKFTEKKPIEKLPLPKQVSIPLQQHIGAPTVPLVEKGSEVAAGQKLAEANGYISVPVHASISGKVKGIEEIDHPVAGRGKAVIIEGDGNEKWIDSIQFDEKYFDLPVNDMRTRIKEAGLAGMGGATFPTHVKLTPPSGKAIDTAILNGVECEPYLTSDHRLMLEHPEEILNGFRIIMKILGVKRGIIGIESNKKDAISLMKKSVPKGAGIEVVSLPVKYPQGAEKQLIKATLNREVPSGGLPMDIGVVVQNVGTARAVFEAVAYQRPLTQRVVTVTGPGIKEPKNVLVPVGTAFQNVIDFCGGLTDKASKIVMGGPMMGITQPSLAVPVLKGTSGILILEDKQAHLEAEEPCINCGRCVAVCPSNLLPTTLQRLVINDRIELAERFHIMDCIECGSCSYICPANRYLVQSIRHGKQQVIQLRKKAG
ncbi:MAG: electron transporter RnfC [Caldithrix sp. RBG_13_44_9]|nr:MAG: electron transporter RnfC [Caldithrix sp. RBG_13_44_9]